MMKATFKSTEYIDSVKTFLSRNTFIITVVSYSFLVFLSTIVLLWRYPNNFTHPNFYAEDGSIFLQNIIDKGWVNSLVTPFNGYFVFGVYLLTQFGIFINWVFGSGTLLSLPTYLSLGSVIFMASVISLPYILFQTIFGKSRSLMVVIFSLLLPLPMSPHIVVGTVGNQKWIFIYLAFLVSLYRILSYGKLRAKSFLFTDITLFISAYTNSTVYVIIPLLFVPYLKNIWASKNKIGLKKSLLIELDKTDLRSLLVLTFALIPQVLFVLIHGIPKIQGYLDSAFNPSRAIELFINRTYLFDFTHVINGYLNDFIVVVLFVIMFVLGWVLLKQKERTAFLLAIYSAGLASLLFVINRPGVTDFFSNYSASGSGPDQFFYAQSLIMYFPITLLIFAISSQFKQGKFKKSTLLICSLLLVTAGLYSNYKYVGQWRNASVFENSVGTFIDQSLVACNSKPGKTVKIVVYPYEDGRFSLKTKWNEVCNKDIDRYQKTSDDLGLAPYNNHYLPIQKGGEFYQSFFANKNSLTGIRIYLSTFNLPTNHKSYRLVVYDSMCHQEIRSVTIQQIIMDNSFYNARFTPINDSSNKHYCFSLSEQDKAANPLAIQLSQPNIYNEGILKINKTEQRTDAVFEPLYEQRKP